MKPANIFYAALAVAIVVAALSGCQRQQDQGPAEQAGRKLDQVTQKAGAELTQAARDTNAKLADAAKETSDKINEATEEAGRKIEKAGEKIQASAREARNK
jgi:gas vesicle protein